MPCVQCSICARNGIRIELVQGCRHVAMMLRLMIPFKERVVRVQIAPNMKRLFLLFTILFAAISVFAQPDYKSQEVADGDGVPVLIKHLPDWEAVREKAKITGRIEDVGKEFGNAAVLSTFEFDAGSEAVYADYPEGRLLIVEFPTPQGSAAADAAIQGRLAESPGVVYKRIGNYNAFVFGSTDAAAANALLDKIDYGKTVQWLGEDPYFLDRFQRYIALQGRDMVLSTVIFIAGVLGIAALIGVLGGFVYYRFRQQKQAQWHAFSDAGGLTRLNLDELSE